MPGRIGRGVSARRLLAVGTVTGMHRSRHCARPTCGAPAAASLTYHYGSRSVWLDNLDEELDPSSYDLCSGHAARLRVRVGWALDDRRTPIIQLRPSLAG